MIVASKFKIDKNGNLRWIYNFYYKYEKYDTYFKSIGRYTKNGIVSQTSPSAMLDWLAHWKITKFASVVQPILTTIMQEKEIILYENKIITIIK